MAQSNRRMGASQILVRPSQIVEGARVKNGSLPERIWNHTSMTVAVARLVPCLPQQPLLRVLFALSLIPRWSRPQGEGYERVCYARVCGDYMCYDYMCYDYMCYDYERVCRERVCCESVCHERVFPINHYHLPWPRGVQTMKQTLS